MTHAKPSTTPARKPPQSMRFVFRLIPMALVWGALNGDDWASWRIGLPAIVVAAWISLRMTPPGGWRISIGPAIAFAGYFARESLRGAWDVAALALGRKLELSPAFVRYPVRLPEGTARCLYCGIISLLPGSAVVAIDRTEITVHVLTRSPAMEVELRNLEDRVAAVFGLSLPELQGGAR